MSTPFDTQRVRADLVAELQAAETEQANRTIETNSDIETAIALGYHIQWLKNKLNFLNSPTYQEQKKEAQS